MPDPTTPNLVLAQPIRGSDTGVWDIPVNGNTGIIDQAFGGVTTLALSSSPVTLTTSQAQNSVIRLTGTLLAHVFIFLPSIYKFWTIDNQITNSLTGFSVALVSTSVTSNLGLPPGTTDVFYDGTTVNYRNLGRVGEYWDCAATQVPSWVALCTKPPYLNCDGTSFSSATYPILFNTLGSGTLPDARGSARYSLNQGTGRLTAAVGGINGDTILASKTTQSMTLVTANLPAYTPTGGVSQVTGTGPVQGGGNTGGSSVLTAFGFGTNTTSLQALALALSGQSFTGNAQGGTSTPFGSIGTAYIGGITMIRAG